MTGGLPYPRVRAGSLASARAPSSSLILSGAVSCSRPPIRSPLPTVLPLSRLPLRLPHRSQSVARVGREKQRRLLLPCRRASRPVAAAWRRPTCDRQPRNRLRMSFRHQRPKEARADRGRRQRPLPRSRSLRIGAVLRTGKNGNTRRSPTPSRPTRDQRWSDAGRRYPPAGSRWPGIRALGRVRVPSVPVAPLLVWLAAPSGRCRSRLASDRSAVLLGDGEDRGPGRHALLEVRPAGRRLLVG